MMSAISDQDMNAMLAEESRVSTYSSKKLPARILVLLRTLCSILELLLVTQ